MEKDNNKKKNQLAIESICCHISIELHAKA